MRLFWRALLVLLAVIVVLPLAVWLVLYRPNGAVAGNDPVLRFDHGSIGNEERLGVPYWIWRVLPQVFPEHLPGDRDGYGAFGVNWVPGAELPVGFSGARLGLVRTIAPNCAFCHQGSYRLGSHEPAMHVPAGPGTRIDAEAYVRFLAAVARDPRFTADRIMAEIDRIVALPPPERLLYRSVLVPMTRERLSRIAARFAWAGARPAWGPGRADRVDELKFHTLAMGDDGAIGTADIMPLWRLGRPAGDGGPARLFADGLGTDVTEAATIAAIASGLERRSQPAVDDDLRVMADFARVAEPPRSPFSPHRRADDPLHVDQAAVDAGRAVFARECAACHAPSGERFRTVIPAGEVGTDPHRHAAWTDEARTRLEAHDAAAWRLVSLRPSDGYVATGLDGLWLRAPYLHNGSVPTLAALLAPPESRPVTFYRGGDLVDPVAGGFVATGPDAGRFLVDTRLPGNGNGGHLWGTALPGDEKDALLAYLKTL